MATYGSALYDLSVYDASGSTLTPTDAAALGFTDAALDVSPVDEHTVQVTWRIPTTAHIKRLIVRSLAGFPPDPTSPQSVILLSVDAENPADPNYTTTTLLDSVSPGSEVYYTMFVLIPFVVTATTGGGGVSTLNGSAILTSGSTMTVSGDLGIKVAMRSIPLVTTSGTVTVPTTGGGGLWFANPNSVPGGASTYTGSGSLATAMAAVPTNGALALNYNGVINEDIDIFINPGVTITSGPGFRPWVNGNVRLRNSSDTNTAKVWGLSVMNTSPAASEHMLKLDAGSIEFAYAEVMIPGSTGCYTLIRPGQTLKNWRVHHCWIHDNPGVASHDGNQDHGLYISGEVNPQNGRVDHCLIEQMPRGRNIKIGGPSGGGGAIGDITIDHCTLITGYGPSNGQVSNGTTNTRWQNNILIDSGATRSLTEGSGASGGNTYSNNRSDRTTGPATANFSDAGGNVVLSLSQLNDQVTLGAAGFGHLDGSGGGSPPPAPTTNYIQRLGSAQHNTSANTTVVTLTASATAGNHVVLSAGSSSTGRTITSVTDSKGNTWTVRDTNVNGTTCRVTVCTSPMSTTLVSGDTVTVNWSALVTTAGVCVDEVASGVTVTPSVSGAAVNNLVGDTVMSGTLTSAAPAQAMMLTVIGFSGSSISTTSNTGDTVSAAVASAAASGNRGVQLVYRNIAASDAGSVDFTFASLRVACSVSVALPY